VQASMFQMKPNVAEFTNSLPSSPKRTMALMLIAFACFVNPGLSAIEFIGVMELGGRTAPLFLLHETSSNTNSDWVRVGQTFRGYKVFAYTKPDEAITLVRDNEKITVFLKKSAVTQETNGITGTFVLRPGPGASFSELRLAYDQPSQFDLGDGRSLVILLKTTDSKYGRVNYQVTTLKRMDNGEFRQVTKAYLIDPPNTFINYILEGEELFSFRPKK